MRKGTAGEDMSYTDIGRHIYNQLNVYQNE